MSLFKNIKNKIARQKLRKQLSGFERKKHVLNYDKVKTIGLLFSINELNSLSGFNNIIESLTADGKQVSSICFFKRHKKLLKNTNTFKIDLLLQNHISFLSIPKAQFVTNFISNDFDLLINLGDYSEFPLFYIASLSKSKFKAGKFIEKESIILPYDFMFKSELTATELLDGIVNLLKSIDFAKQE